LDSSFSSKPTAVSKYFSTLFPSLFTTPAKSGKFPFKTYTPKYKLITDKNNEEKRSEEQIK